MSEALDEIKLSTKEKRKEEEEDVMMVGAVKRGGGKDGRKEGYPSRGGNLRLQGYKSGEFI